jgi:hypothetical protein
MAGINLDLRRRSADVRKSFFVGPPLSVAGDPLLPWLASHSQVKSRSRVYKEELAERGYWLLDGITSTTPGCGGMILEWPLHSTLHRMARLPVLACDQAQIPITGTRCERTASVRFSFHQLFIVYR